MIRVGSDEPELEFSGSSRAMKVPSRAELGHLNFRAEKNFFSHFSQVFNYQILLVYRVPKQFCDHLLANKVFLELHYMNYTYKMHNLV